MQTTVTLALKTITATPRSRFTALDSKSANLRETPTTGCGFFVVEKLKITVFIKEQLRTNQTQFSLSFQNFRLPLLFSESEFKGECVIGRTTANSPGLGETIGAT